MNISPLEEYALRCAVQLARLSPDTHLSASKLAEMEGISVEYASKIMFLFRQANLVESVRGLRGGFKLARPPGDITVRQILGALPVAKRMEGEFCDQFVGQMKACVHVSCCSIRPFWGMVSQFVDQLTSAVSLQDLIDPEAHVRSRLGAMTVTKVQGLKGR